MMYIQSRKRKWVSPFSSFLLFSPHFPLNLNCQTNWKGKKPNHSEDPNSRASSSSTTPPGGDYEVFLSFRGKDTRKSFTDYLYTSLVDVGIHVFRDDNELRVGEEIGPELLRNITQSKISIPIISDDYASSKWCLRELAHMLKCKRNKGQIVLPIFYKVDPSQVRHLIGRWEDAINAHKKNLDKMIVQEWEEALKEVGSLKGWESEKVENGHEGALIKIVVRKVMSKLRTTFQVTDLEQFVGIDYRVEKIMSLIDPKFNDTRIIGIYGMGGIGKTTLARVLYHNLSSHFDHLSFVANVRETSLRKGIEHLQKQLIKDILRNPYDVSNVFEGINFIKSRFTSKKVLLLLDDMDDNAHLNALAGDSSWFKAGSIVIITTRNKAILDKARAGSMHQLNELPSDQSLILFSRHAFRKDFPSSDYEHISRAIVSTTGGLPLALEVIGSLLREKTMKVWEETLKKLRSVPVQKVQETLKISYEALDDGEKQIFLDIACFFIGESQESPIYMWDACGFFPGTGIEVLSDMSLIKIDGDGTFMMHDQLRDLGREIVRLENPMEPQQRSRLWIEEEAKLVLDGNKGTSKIQALRLHLNGWREICTAETFKELTNLRFLQLKGVNLTGDFQNLFPQLRWLDWTDYHLDLESTNFHPKKLVVLNLSRSKTSEDWGGWSPQKMAMELKVLNLMKCKKLAQLPNSIGSLKSLQQLLLSKCYSLRQIPDSIRKLTSLTELHLQSTAIEELPKSIGSLKKLKTLNASYCASLTHIPNSIGDLASLSCLDLTKCEKLAQFPESISSLMSLQQLLLSECHSLRKIPDSIGKLTLLSKLYLQSTAIKELPESIGSLKELKTLDASFCALLARIPNSIGNLVSLSHLDLTACQKLAQLPESIGSLMSLQQLLLLGCRSLRQIPDSIGKLISLTKLDLRFSAIEELPESIGSLKELKTLNASFCTSLARIPNSTVLLKHCKIPPANNSTMYYQRTVSEDVLKRSRPFGISDEDSESMADVKPRIDDDSADKSRIWKLTEINEPSQCNSIRLPDTLTATRVSRLIYLNSGRAILALSSNAVPKHWKWQGSRASSSVVPRLCRPPDWNWMSNDTSDANPEDAVPCFALSKNESYIISASGGKIYLFNMITCKMTTFMHPPAAATFLAFHPQDNNIIAIGMEACSIQIYNVQVDEVKTTLRGHQKRITGLAFSNVSNVLVSSGADSQLCVWSTDGWEKQASKVLQMPSGRGASPLADTHVQFHLDQTHLLVVHKTQIAIYEAPKLRCLKQWVTREASSPITHATYSCDGQSIYVSFEDGSIGVLTTSTLIFRCRINPAAYIPPNPSLRVYPLVIAAHPFEPNQFALGLTDGCVYVLKPLEFEGKWGISPVENGAGPSTTSGATASEQPQR